MKKIHYIFIFTLLISCLWSCSGTRRTVKEHQKFFPTEINKVYLGMSLNQLKSVRNTNTLSVDPGKLITYAFETFVDKDYSKINYQFDDNQILYEIIITFNGNIDVYKRFEKEYGPSNSKKEWIFENVNVDNLNLKIWVYENRFCIGIQKYFK